MPTNNSPSNDSLNHVNNSRVCSILLKSLQVRPFIRDKVRGPVKCLKRIKDKKGGPDKLDLLVLIGNDVSFFSLFWCLLISSSHYLMFSFMAIKFFFELVFSTALITVKWS